MAQWLNNLFSNRWLTGDHVVSSFDVHGMHPQLFLRVTAVSWVFEKETSHVENGTANLAQQAQKPRIWKGLEMEKWVRNTVPVLTLRYIILTKKFKKIVNFVKF